MNTFTPYYLGGNPSDEDSFGWAGCPVIVVDENGKAVKGTITGLSASDPLGYGGLDLGANYAVIKILLKPLSVRNITIDKAVGDIADLFTEGDMPEKYKGSNVWDIEEAIRVFGPMVGVTIRNILPPGVRRCSTYGCFECDSPDTKYVIVKDKYGIRRFTPYRPVYNQIMKAVNSANE